VSEGRGASGEEAGDGTCSFCVFRFWLCVFLWSRSCVVLDGVGAREGLVIMSKVGMEPERGAERHYGCKSVLPSFVPQFVRLVICMAWMMVCVALVLVVAPLLLPKRRWRACIVKVFMVLFAPVVYAVYGIRLRVTGMENRGSLARREPVVYLANHSSTLDVVTCSRVTSTGTIAIVKKELLVHPIGWIAWLNGTIFIDRSSREKAIKSVNSISGLLRKHGLSVCVFPEGTRSKDGRLQPFKKGAMHLAMQSKVPIVPVVVTGAHKLWGRKGWGVKCDGDPIEIKFLPAIDTSGWTPESLAKHTEDLHALFIRHLPEDQRPLKGE